jgi:hypothetical protein
MEPRFHAVRAGSHISIDNSVLILPWSPQFKPGSRKITFFPTVQIAERALLYLKSVAFAHSSW